MGEEVVEQMVPVAQLPGPEQGGHRANSAGRLTTNTLTLLHYQSFKCLETW